MHCRNKGVLELPCWSCDLVVLIELSQSAIHYKSQAYQTKLSGVPGNQINSTTKNIFLARWKIEAHGEKTSKAEKRFIESTYIPIIVPSCSVNIGWSLWYANIPMGWDPRMYSRAHCKKTTQAANSRLLKN